MKIYRVGQKFLESGLFLGTREREVPGNERKSDEYADAAAKEASRDGKAASGEGLAEGSNGGATDCQVRASHGGTEVTRGRWRAQKGPTAQQVARI